MTFNSESHVHPLPKKKQFFSPMTELGIIKWNPMAQDRETEPIAIFDQEQEALKRANRVFTNRIASLLDKDPTFDLTEFLEQQAKSYPKIRKSLAETARRRASGAVNPVNGVPSKENKLYGLLINESVHIIHPLCDDVLRLAGSSQLSPLESPGFGQSWQLDSEITTGLNQAISHGRVLWNLGNTFVLDIGSSVAVKIGSSIDIDHIATIKYIKSQAPEVPIPNVLGVLRTDQKTYLFMSRAQGLPLDKIWCDLNTSQKTSVQRQLDSIFRALRRIPPSSELTEPLGGGVPPRCKDMRRFERVSPTTLREEAELNDFLCTADGRTQTPWIRMIRSLMRDDHAIVMTHGDLHPRNVMVTVDDSKSAGSHPNSGDEMDNIKITAIIDWETSGWYPEHWEYVKAFNTIGPGDALLDWCDYLPQNVIGVWPIELAMDLLISRWLG